MTAAPLSRRQLLRPDAWATAPAAAAVAWQARTAAEMPAPDLETLMLSRAGFGPRPEEVDEARKLGARAWLEQQIDWRAIDDSAVEKALTDMLPTLAMSEAELFGVYEDMARKAYNELRWASVYRQVFSRRQLHEVMVDFWSDHFSIDHDSVFCRVLKTVEDRDVIRRHALGNFKELLTASAQSPCMLHYLDNDVNTRRKPNENYGREIMELHTLGVAVEGHPYSEEDVFEVARCFTGWAWTRRNRRVDSNPDIGKFLYTAGQHDDSAKNVLGNYIPAGLGEQDGHMVIDILCQHPATATFLATKLVRRFVTDDPAAEAPELVQRVADSFTRTEGDIPEMLRTIFLSAEFAASFATGGGKLTRPMDHVVRALRAVDVQPADFGDNDRALSRTFNQLVGGRGFLAQMDHLPFGWPTPDGYPDTMERWVTTSQMLARWNYGLAMCGVSQGAQLITGFKPERARPADVDTVGAAVDWWLARLLHREMTAADRQHVVEFLSAGVGEEAAMAGDVIRREPFAIALIIASPYFQWR
jgi:uncharacterized protein (DUF1800 family)